VVPAADTSYTATFTVNEPPPAPIAFVQQAAAVPQSPQSNVNLAYPQAQTAGNLNVVVIGWNDATANVSSVTDSAGNTYQVAAPLTRGTGVSQVVYYAKNVVGGPANTVMVAFDRPATYVDLRIAEYAGISRTNPLDVTASGTGTGNSAATAAATTTNAKALLVGAGTTFTKFTAAGTNYTLRVITKPNADILEDRTVSATGSYTATANHAGNGNWVLQLVAFRGQ
jgi:hypothetical protein